MLLHKDTHLKELLKAKYYFFKSTKNEYPFHGCVKDFKVHLNKVKELKKEVVTKSLSQPAVVNDEFPFIRSLYELAKFKPEIYSHQVSRVPYRART